MLAIWYLISTWHKADFVPSLSCACNQPLRGSRAFLAVALSYSLSTQPLRQMDERDEFCFLENQRRGAPRMSKAIWLLKNVENSHLVPAITWFPCDDHVTTTWPDCLIAPRFSFSFLTPTPFLSALIFILQKLYRATFLLMRGNLFPISMLHYLISEIGDLVPRWYVVWKNTVAALSF